MCIVSFRWCVFCLLVVLVLVNVNVNLYSASLQKNNVSNALHVPSLVQKKHL